MGKVSEALLQGSLFHEQYYDPKKLARRNDPSTSHAAARTAKINRRQYEVLKIMLDNSRSDWISDELDKYSKTPGLWRRVGELERMGKIRFTGGTRAGKSGKQQRCFVLT